MPGNAWMVGIALVVVAGGAACGRAVADAGPGPERTDVTSDLAAAARPLNHPADAPSAGLAALSAAIGDAQVVLLGEPWHGDGGAIELRAELVRHLHRELGFDVLAFEADFYSVTRGWQDVGSGPVREFAGENVYPFWSISRASGELWDYIAAQRFGERPLDVVGLDPKHVGAVARRTLPRELEARLVRLTAVPEAERAQFLATLDGYLEREQIHRPGEEEQHHFLRVLDLLERGLHGLPRDAREPFWEQEVRNLRSAVRFSWEGASRDRAMGENLAWIVTHLHPGRKVIVWGHNNHILTDKWAYFGAPDTAIRRALERRSPFAVYRATYLGVEARQIFGNRVYALATLSHQGSFTPDIRTNVEPDSGRFERGDFATDRPLAAATGTLEAALAARGHDRAFLDLRAFRGAPGSVGVRALDYTVTPPRDLRLWDAFDGVVFLSRTHGLDAMPTDSP